jgi:hypothetical protein
MAAIGIAIGNSIACVCARVRVCVCACASLSLPFLFLADYIVCSHTHTPFDANSATVLKSYSPT